MRKLGALWENTSKKGSKYMSGEIEIGREKVKVLVFRNNRKDKERSPDYIIYEREPRVTYDSTSDADDDMPPF